MVKMGRPPKDESLKMTIPLRVMLTADQKKAIDQAAALEGQEVSAWVRPVLLEAARRRIAKSGKDKPART